MIPIVSVTATLTLLPGLLASLGPRLDRRRDRRRARHSPTGSAWERWATLVVHRRWLAATTGLAIMVALAIFAIKLNPGQPASSSLAASGPARSGLASIEHSGLGSGTLTPIEVLTPVTSVRATAHRLAAINGVRAVLEPDGPKWRHAAQQLLEVIPVRDSATEDGRATLDAIRAQHSSRLLVGGVNAQDSDLTNAIYSSFPLMAGLIAVLTFLLLAVALRSIVLPLKAIILNILSIRLRLRRRRPDLARRTRLAADRQRPRHRSDHQLGPARDLRLPLRALDGLRGVHPHPHT